MPNDSQPLRSPLDQSSNHIDCLPNALIADILLYIPASLPTTRDKLAFPIIIQNVSRRWRSIVTGFSALWSILHIETRRFNETKVMGYLERSGTSPLEVHLVEHLEGLVEPWATQNLWHDILKGVATRVRQLKINSFNSSSSTIVEDLVRRPLSFGFPNLTECSVTLWNGQLPFHIAAPRLRSLYVMNCKRLLPAYWDLEELRLSMLAVTGHEFASIMLASPRLQVLDLQDCRIKGGLESPQPIVLDRLNSLSLRYMDIRKTGHILECFKAPQLKTLILYRPSGFNTRRDWSHGLDFPKLETLALFDVEFTMSLGIAKKLAISPRFLVFEVKSGKNDELVQGLLAYWEEEGVHDIALEVLVAKLGPRIHRRFLGLAPRLHAWFWREPDSWSSIRCRENDWLEHENRTAGPSVEVVSRLMRLGDLEPSPNYED